jgi:hypothetical protein
MLSGTKMHINKATFKCKGCSISQNQPRAEERGGQTKDQNSHKQKVKGMSFLYYMREQI